MLQKLPGKTVILGTLDLSDMTIESAETVAARIRRALPYVSAERIVVAPDCGPEITAARGRLRENVRDGRRREDRAEGASR